jgi:hypothetical protein
MNRLTDLMAEVAATQRAELERLRLAPEVARRLAAGGKRTGARRPIGWAAMGLAVAAAVTLVATTKGRGLVGRLLGPT